MDRAVGKVERSLEGINNIPGISSKNKALAAQYASRLRSLGRKENTRVKHMYYLKRVLEIKPKIDFERATREDIEELLDKFDAINAAKFDKHNAPEKEHNSIKYDFKKILKFFYKQMFGEGFYYPKVVGWLKLGKASDQKIMPADILSEAEILRMIGKATSSRDKALIALGFDSGIRSGEVVNMRKRDVDLSSATGHITVDGKTGQRTIPVFFAAPYLAQYLNDVKDLEPEDYLWHTLAQSHIKARLKASGVNKMVKDLAKAAGIKKRVWWHLLRHSRASFYAPKLTEQSLKAYFGWTASSKMAATYVHLSGRDIDNAVLQANGLKVEEANEKPLLSSKECPKCKYTNGVDLSYCGRCGSALDIATAMEIQNRGSAVKDAVAEALKDPKAIEEIVHAYLLMQAKKGKK